MFTIRILKGKSLSEQPKELKVYHLINDDMFIQGRKILIDLNKERQSNYAWKLLSIPFMGYFRML